MMFRQRWFLLLTPILVALLWMGSAMAQNSPVYRLVLLDRHSDRSHAERIVGDLSEYNDVELVSNADGSYTILMGRYDSRAEAEAARTALRGQGLIATGIREVAQTSDFDELIEELRAVDWDDVRTPAPTAPGPTPAGTQLQQQAEALMTQARGAEEQGDLEGAVVLWEHVRALMSEGPAYTAAQSNITRLNQIRREQRDTGTTPAGTTDADSNLLLVIGVIVLVVIVLAVLTVLVMMRKTREKNEELLKQVEALAHSGGNPASAMPSARGAAAASAVGASTSKPALPKAPPTKAKSQKEVEPPKEEEDFVRLDPTDRIRPGSVSYDEQKQAEADKAAAPAAPKKKPSTAGLPPKPRKTTPPPSSSTPDEDDEGGLKLDFLFDEPAKDEPGPKDEEAKQDEPVRKSKDSSTEFIIPPQPDVEPGTAPAGKSTPAPTKPAAPKPAANSNVYYEQDFDSEEVGNVPDNWRGEYEYANLTVAEVDENGEKRKCMRFEKTTGIGSAYYSCCFPDARGRIGVEFDLRCDDKNKYLLGFYIEKDEDFRQSIHTIVHRTNSSANPTLRIQNESTPYEFGKWTHVKFDIDLTRQLLDCYIDGEPLEMGLRLNSSPKAINTLSIRDNLATTGVLLIDNIKIYRVQ